jgi:hypothetical protein
VAFTGSPVWQTLSLAGVLPLQRADHKIILDPVADRIVLYGGEGLGGSYLNDTWELHLASLVDAPARPPLALRLGAVVPNPSRAATSIGFELPRAGGARVEIFDLAGRLVRVLDAPALGEGQNALRWDGASSSGETAPAGVYFYRLGAGGEWRSGKLVRIE